MALWAQVEGSAAPAKTAKKADDDMDDLFGSDDDDGAAAKAAAAKAKEASKPKKEKKKVIAMSIVFLEVKPLDDTIDLDALAPKIYKGIVKDGLFWKTEYKKVPVAFGIFKLIVAFSCEDEKISVDDITEEIENMTDFVQSCDIQSFNKI
jgi:elongation factor 1-beta